MDPGRASFGQITDEQWDTIRPYVKGREVTDLGAFKLVYSEKLLTLGAKSVIAVEKEYMPDPRDSRITCVQTTFGRYKKPIDTAFVSWPQNYESGIVSCVGTAKRIIVISKNTDGTGCATPAFYAMLLQRKLDAYVPDRRGCLIIVSRALKHPRKPTGEEKAGSFINEFMTYEQSEGLPGGGRWVPFQL